MRPRLSLYRDGLQLTAGREPSLSTGVVTWRGGRGSVPICIDVVERLCRFYAEDLYIEPTALRALRTQREALRALLAAQQDDGTPTPSGLWKHQGVAERYLRVARRGILADEQGMGKTVSALVAAGVPRYGLIVCHSVKRDDWQDHVERWVDVPCHILEGDASERQETLDRWANGGTHGTGYLICNYAQVVMHASDLVSADVVILDEVHKVRNRKSLWKKALTRITKGDKLVFMLTANPSVNHPLDLWSLLSLCDPNRFRSYWSFVYRFFDTSSNGYGIEIGDPKPHEKEALERIVAPYVLSRTRAEVGGLGVPRVVRRVVYHEMTGLQADLYDALTSSGQAQYGDQLLETWLPIQKITRQRQMVLDPGLLFDGYEGPSKYDTLVKIVRESTRPTLVFSMLAEIAASSARRLDTEEGIAADVLDGSMTDAERAAVLDAFACGRIQVLCATHGTGGEGLNLQTASRVIYMELAWHPAGNKQAQDRAVRPGQQADYVEIILIHTPDTIEDDVFDIVKHKGRVTVSELIRRESARARERG